MKLAGKRLSVLADSKMRIKNSTIEEFCSTYILLFTLIKRETPWKYVNTRTYFFTSRGIETILNKVIIANATNVQCISYAILPFKFVKMYLIHNFKLD